MKVVVVTKAKIMGVERVYKVFATRKNAEKHLRQLYPWLKKDSDNAYIGGTNEKIMFFFHEVEVE